MSLEHFLTQETVALVFNEAIYINRGVKNRELPPEPPPRSEREVIVMLLSVGEVEKARKLQDKLDRQEAMFD